MDKHGLLRRKRIKPRKAVAENFITTAFCVLVFWKKLHHDQGGEFENHLFKTPGKAVWDWTPKGYPIPSVRQRASGTFQSYLPGHAMNSTGNAKVTLERSLPKNGTRLQFHAL